ncbi:MAG: sensor histidine kinase [Bacteroidota bacterium]
MSFYKRIANPVVIILILLVLLSYLLVYFVSGTHELIMVFLVLFIINVVLIIAFSFYFTRKTLHPVSRLVEQMNEVDINNLGIRIVSENKDGELAQLANTFNTMLDRLESAFLLQKSFVSSSSHELRTPLTVITGQLEVALMQNRSNEEYRTTLVSVLEDIKNLNQLANKLLVLSRAGNEITNESFDTIRIDEILWRSRAEILKVHPEYDVIIHFDDTIFAEQHFNITGSPQLLSTAFINLIENGCKYSKSHKSRILLGVDEHHLRISFEDEGIGIPPEEIDNVFQPFYRASNAPPVKGHGIGLSLVKRIVTLHQGTIHVSSELNEGSAFMLAFPLNTND